MENKAKLEAIRAHEGAKLRQNGKDMVDPAMAAIIETAPEGSTVKTLWGQLQAELQKFQPTGNAATLSHEDYEMALPDIESDSESGEESEEEITIGDKQSKADFNAEQKKRKEEAKAKREERKDKRRKRKDNNCQLRAAIKGIKDACATKGNKLTIAIKK